MENGNFAAELVVAWSMRSDSRPVLLFEDHAVTASEMAESVRILAAELRRLGVRPEDRVGLLLPDSPALIQWFLAVLYVGAVAVPVNGRLSQEDRDFILEDCAPALFVTDRHGDESGWAGPVIHSELLRPALTAAVSGRCAGEAVVPAADVAGSRTCFLLYTSGSTGRPKGVPHSHDDLRVPLRHFAPTVLGAMDRDVLFSSSKLPFAYGLGTQIGLALAGGVPLVLHSGLPVAEDVLHLLQRHRVTLFFSVPTVYNGLLRGRGGGEDLSALRLCFSAGESLPGAISAELRSWLGVDILDGLGTTETMYVFVSNTPDDNMPGTLGRVLPGYDLRLVDAGGQPVPDGQDGRLQVRGPGLTVGYWNRPEARAALFDNGWMSTGDQCVVEQGRLRHLGRADDMIKTGGEWISPQVVEACLLEHPDVVECGVARCRMHGLDYPAAFVVTASGTSADSKLGQTLRRHVRDRLPKYMVPAKIEFLAALPRTATGKIQRHKLRQ